MDQWVGLNDPCGSLPSQDIVLFYGNSDVKGSLNRKLVLIVNLLYKHEISQSRVFFSSYREVSASLFP